MKKYNIVITQEKQRALAMAIGQLLCDYKLTEKEYLEITKWKDRVLEKNLRPKSPNRVLTTCFL